VSDNSAFYQTRIDLTETSGYFVDVTGTIDVRSGTATWILSTVDPATGEIPLDPTVGFLPPDNADGIGQGFVSYTVRPDPDSQTGDVIYAQATITFYTQPPLATPRIFNTIDAGTGLTSAPAALPAREAMPQFVVSWAGTDDSLGSAVSSYTIYVSDNGGPFTAWLENTTLTSATYDGQDNHTYAFYSVATDNAGNRQATPSPLATTQVLMHLWHNYANAHDVNGADGVTPLDVLLIINWINAHPGGTSLPAPPAVPPPYYDVSGGTNGDGDGQITPLDVLVVINYINSHPPGSPEGESARSLVPAPTAAAASLASIGRTAETGLPPKWNRIPSGAVHKTVPQAYDEWERGTKDDPEGEFGQLEPILPDIVDDVHQAWHGR
jgi:hypothetical protein